MLQQVSSGQNHKIRIIWYSFAIFLSSAVLLVLEVVAARIIAPYVGVSIYSWTSIIGVVLAGLSIGNWLGGIWADKDGGEKAVGIALFVAGVFCIASLFLLTLVAPLLQQSKLNLISSSFLYVLSMFFIPAVLLGVVTPILTTCALKLDERTGHIVGRMHALAALGSILGTFITGFWLVQYFGTRAIVIGCAASLFLLALPFLRSTTTKIIVGLLMFVTGTSLLTYARNGFSNPCHWESSYFCLRVEDASDPQFGSAKALVLDHLTHGINHEAEPALLISAYLQLMGELVRTHFSPSAINHLAYFFGGGGAYTQPRAVRALYPEAHVSVAELDPKVTEIAQQHMFVDTKDMHVMHMDARAALQRSQRKYDVVVTDVYHDISVPYHMVTREFAQLVKQKMNTDGLYLVNIIDAFPDPKLVKSLFKTLQLEFKNVDVWIDRLPESVSRLTYVISATNTNRFPEIILSNAGFERRWLRINQPLSITGASLNSLPVLTDDFVPVERLLSDLLFSQQAL
ncbi:MAG: fused MFS/spermidine synthase [Gammaproteobacteria bacterium]|nr:fused MFS/spermidine synthase [Gammaproteobacteria bacterium]